MLLGLQAVAAMGIVTNIFSKWLQQGAVMPYLTIVPLHLPAPSMLQALTHPKSGRVL